MSETACHARAPEPDVEAALSVTAADRTARIISLRKAGATYRSIAAATGEHRSYVHRVLQRAALTNQPEPVDARQARNAEIVRRRLAGETHEQIQQALGLRGHSTVPRVLAAAGLANLSRRAARQLSAEVRGVRDRVVLEMVASGVRPTEVARAVGLDRKTVYKIRKRAKDGKDRQN